MQKKLAKGVVLAAVLSCTLATGVQASHFSHVTGDPGLHSASALVLDSKGNVIYGKNVTEVRSIASITKLMTVMVVLDAGQSLDEKLTISREDRDEEKNTSSRLGYGATLSRREMILLAIMSSENRAASALGRNYPGGLDRFIPAMNKKASELKMSDSHFADPAGLDPANTSTASDLGKMVTAADGYPLIRQASTTKLMAIRPYPGKGELVYNNTNRLLKNANWDIALSKTGYISEAGRCLVMRANIDGEAVSIVLLHAEGKLTPFGDSNRLRQWLLSNS
jgi:serine-type D-Ala-D-Ala endopeptidase (penicillin-binding protein 7)